MLVVNIAYRSAGGGWVNLARGGATDRLPGGESTGLA